MSLVEFSEFSESIRRIIRFNNSRYSIEAISWKSEMPSGLSLGIGPWHNCLYLNFIKDDFQNIVYPKIVPCDWGPKKQRFDYFEGSLAELDWHGGITFYEEKLDIESGKTLIKVGCDYQHFGDDHFQLADHGKKILEGDGKSIAEEFIRKFGEL